MPVGEITGGREGVMNIKKIPLVFSGVVFILSFLYLHQNVQVYVSAYKLSQSCAHYNELIDKSDYLMYNFAKSVSLAKVNQWAEDNEFGFITRSQKIALNLKGEKGSDSESKLAFLYDRFLNFPSASSTALAEDNE